MSSDVLLVVYYYRLQNYKLGRQNARDVQQTSQRVVRGAKSFSNVGRDRPDALDQKHYGKTSEVPAEATGEADVIGNLRSDRLIDYL